MLFPAAADVNGVWGTVARVTARGQLGCDAKVAAAGAGAGAGGGARLICVYTRDFADMEDVRRVAKGLDDLGLIPRERSVYYKPGGFIPLSPSFFFGISGKIVSAPGAGRGGRGCGRALIADT